MIRKVFAVLSLLVFWGCDSENPLKPVLGKKGVYIINGLAETLSFYDIGSNTVLNDFDTTGIYPNQIVIQGDLGYIVNSGSDNIQIFSLTTYTEKGDIDLGGENNSWNIAVVDDSKAYVSFLFTHQVAVVDLKGRSVIKTIPVGKGPQGMLIVQNKLYVCNSGYEGGTYGEGSVSVISTLNDSLLKTIPVGTNPQAIGIDGEGELHIVCTGDFVGIQGWIYLIDPEEDVVVDSIDIGGFPGSIAIAPNGKAYLGDASSGILSYDTRSHQPLRDITNPILPGASIFGVAADSQGTLYACNFNEDSLIIIDTEGDILIGKIGVGDGPLALAIKEEGNSE